MSSNMTTKQFSVIPTEDELKAIGRDLRFHPTHNDQPRALTKQQIEHFNQSGFVAPLDVYASDRNSRDPKLLR
jgi:non-heme Fe2+,alpha-ketoglutarate-dependent halogenase